MKVHVKKVRIQTLLSGLSTPITHVKKVCVQWYCQPCNEKREIPVDRRKFENLWSELLPHMKPATDLCDTCHSNIVKIICSASRPESEKLANLKAAEQHLMITKQERELYNEVFGAVKDLKLNPQSASCPQQF